MFVDIWNSFRRIPAWVQAWVAFVLVPVNLATLGFLDQSHGVYLAVLAIGGMLPNVVIMLNERGLSKIMAIPHLVIWPFLLILICYTLMSSANLPNGYIAFLVMLFVIDAISLVFDTVDFWKWRKGDRAIA